MKWSIVFTPTAKQMLKKIADRRIQAKIIERVGLLAVDPEKQGKPLQAELQGYRSIRAVGQRYRILYTIERQKIVVIIVAVGIRKDGAKVDVYALAKKWVRLMG